MMTDADDNQTGYAAAFESYRAAGWIGILPLARGRKGGKEARLPAGFSGRPGIDPSYADSLQWVETRPLDNLCLRLPRNIIGIDVDHYDAKTGGLTLAEAIKRWGPLPATTRTTSRGEGDPTSGIRLFKIPEGLEFLESINFPELGIGDIEIIQHHHRYAVAWPSIHPEGRGYWWYDDEQHIVGIPHVDDIPNLPPAWVAALTAPPTTGVMASVNYDVHKALTPGEPSQAVRHRLQGAIKELYGAGVCHHDCVRKHSMAMLHLGKSGEPGVKNALEILGTIFVDSVEGQRDGGRDEAVSEYRSMVLGPGAARELGKVGILDWVTTIPVHDLGGGANPKVVESGPEIPERVVGPDSSTSPSPPGQDIRPHSPLTDIERGFWDSRESLGQIYQTAMASMGSPWGILGVCAARALAQVRPHVTLPPVIGQGPGSLNWFLALVAGSGGGKTTSMATAEYLVPGHIITCQQGTGEGILATFGRAGDPSDPDQIPEFESVMVDIDEVDSLGAVGGRSGSTTMPTLRSAFSGANLGFAYAAKDKRRFIRRHTYRMTAVVGVQPTRARWIIEDVGGGTPQRFMWFPALDPRVRWKTKPWPTGPLTLPPPSAWMYATQLRIPPEAEELLGMEHEKRAQGGENALDGHALFCREKFAFALAVLDGRTRMTSEDWELSGIAADVSLFTRESVVDELKAATRIEAIDRGEVRGIELASSDDAKQHEESERIRHALRWALKKIEASGPEGISHRDLNNSADSKRTRRWLPSAVQVGQSNGLIRQLEGTTQWVKI